MRAIIYLRQSQDRTGQEFGVERQRQDAHRLAALRGWTVVAEVPDNDITASGRRRRAGYEQVLKALTRGEVDAVIAWDMTRLSRNARDTLRLMEAGEAARATLAFVRGSDLNLATADGRTMANILASIAQGEIDKKAERQERAAQQAAEKGKWIGGRRPFGYGPDGVTVMEAEAAALRDAYNDVLVHVPLGRIARKWNAQGLVTPQSRRTYGHGCGGQCDASVPARLCLDRKPLRTYAHGCVGGCADGTPSAECPQRVSGGDPSPWTGQALRSTLLNPRNAGLRSHVTQDFRASGRDLRKARIDAIIGPAEWPAIVSEETWRAAVDIIIDPSRANPARSGQGLLTGVARCGAPGGILVMRDGAEHRICGATVHRGAAPRRRGRSGYATYRCRHAFGHIGRAADIVDQHVSDLVIKRLRAPDAARLLEDDTRPDADDLRREQRKLRVKLDSLASLLREEVLTEAGVRRESQKIKTRMAEIGAELADDGRTALRPLVSAADVRGAWESFDTDRQRHVISVLFGHLVLLPPGRGRRLTPENVGATVLCMLADWAAVDHITGGAWTG